MQLNQLSISYKCHNSIGNSLELDEMMQEVLKSFIKETDAISGSFYLDEEPSKTHIVSFGKNINHDIESLWTKSDENKILINKYDENLNLLIYKLEKGLIFFIYDKEIDLDFIILIFESLRKRLDISINSCINVRDLQKKNQELNTLTSNLQSEVNKAVEENNKKEKKMFEQIKMAQMGELIGNIAHQWRQPLSVISTVASGMKLKKEMKLLSDDDFTSYIDKIVENSQLLSKTIDEFRDYINESHKRKDIIIQDRVEMALKIIEPSCELNGIKILKGFVCEEPIYFRLISGELLQVLISVLNNAKEALSERDVKNKWIKYSVNENEDRILITIEDNAGGINPDIKDKIFNPYFTTKHQSHGTGIGLYNCYNIVTKHLEGKLYFKNTYDGTKFCIELPKNINYSI